MAEFDDLIWEKYTQDVNKIPQKKVDFLVLSSRETRRPLETNDLPLKTSKRSLLPIQGPIYVDEKRKHVPEARDLKQHVRRKKLTLEATLDLHGLTQAQAFDTLTHFIQTSFLKSKRFVLIITGKGGLKSDQPQGVLRQKLPDWLNHPSLSSFVVSFSEALLTHGGAGAYYVHLRKKK